MIIKFFLHLLLLCNLNESYQFSNTNLIINKRPATYKNNILMVENICPEYLEKFTKFLDFEKSEAIVKGTTSFLTKVDGVGGYILHTNDIIINYLLNNSYLNMETKKSLILTLIQFSQMGDSTGHQILQLYHDLVSCLL
jgi:hypothetical protein